MKSKDSKEVSKTLKIIKEEIKEIVKILKKYIVFLSFFIFFAISILIAIFSISKIISLIILSSSFFVLSLLIFLNDKIQKAKKYKFRPKERFTKKNDVGDISIDENKIHQAIIYLSLLEDEIW